MPETTRTIESLHNLILSRISPSSFCIIGIDGTDGSGKSTLAQQLTSGLKGTIVELDSLIEKHRGIYVDSLDCTALISAILSCKSQSVLMIVEGICLLAALEQIKVKPSLLVYVKRISNHGIWLDEYYCEPKENPSAAIEKLQQMFAPMDDEASTQNDNLLFEIARYHQSYKPTEKADVFFERVIDE